MRLPFGGPDDMQMPMCPGAVDMMIRQAAMMAWMLLPSHRKNRSDLFEGLQHILQRVLGDMSEVLACPPESQQGYLAGITSPLQMLSGAVTLIWMQMPEGQRNVDAAGAELRRRVDEILLDLWKGSQEVDAEDLMGDPLRMMMQQYWQAAPQTGKTFRQAEQDLRDALEKLIGYLREDARTFGTGQTP